MIKKILLSTIVVALIVCSVYFFEATALIVIASLSCCVMALLLGLFLRQKTVNQTEVRAMIGNRIWDIPVELQCQRCKTVNHIHFHLGTREFKCANTDCEEVNSVHVQFISAISNNE